MFSFFKTKKIKTIDEIYEKIKTVYGNEEISEERKSELNSQLEKFGYIRERELTNSEILYCFEKKCEKFNFGSSLNVGNSEIKEINLTGIENCDNICNLIKELLYLPTKNGEVLTSIFLTPFYIRDFDCSYYIKGLKISPKIEDKLAELDGESVVRVFVGLAKKCGHAVFTDFMTRFARYSEPFLAKPYLARWIDVKYAEEKINSYIPNVVEELEKTYDKDDVEIVKNIYGQSSKGCLSEDYAKIYEVFKYHLIEYKKKLCKEMYSKENQIKLQKRVQKIVLEFEKKDVDEYTMQNARKITEKLIQEGLWTLPCGAYKEDGLPIFDYMNSEENYPVFKHFDKDGNNISELVKNDFQAPAYLSENGYLNEKVAKYFIDFAVKQKETFNFDGFKIDYVKHIFDEDKEIPKEFVKKLVETLKKKNFTILIDGDYKKFKDIADVVFDTLNYDCPQTILSNSGNLANFNTEVGKSISIIRTYNNRFDLTAGLEKKEALFKWFCLHFLPAGKNALCPILFTDGDETFTEYEFSKSLGEDEKIAKNYDDEFLNEFRAISDFRNKSDIIRNGEAVIITEDDDGFVSWLISKEPAKEYILAVANYKPIRENIILQDSEEKIETIKENDAVVNKMLHLPGELKVSKEYVFDGESFIEKDFEQTDLLEFEVLNPCEYRVFLLKR